MAFKLVDIPKTFKVKVSFYMPGSNVKKSVEAEYMLLDKKARFELESMDVQEQDDYFIDNVLIGIHGVTDEDGNAISPDAAKSILDYDFIRIPVITAYSNNQLGRKSGN